MPALVSVCGLIVIPGREEQGWESVMWPVELDVVDLSVALNFAQLHVATEALGNGHQGASMIAASFHSGDPGRCDGIDYADQPVRMSEELEHYGTSYKTYTVCGFYADTWQTYSGVVEAISPRAAYCRCFETVGELEDRYLYVANVHEGEVERCAIPGTGLPPAFGDPLATSPVEMRYRLDQILGRES